MNNARDVKQLLSQFSTMELWAELGRRFKIEYGKIQMAFHRGRPSGIAEIDFKIKVDPNLEVMST